MENKTIYFAGGCFWGTEHYFKMIKGVVGSTVGYANSIMENPSYKDVCSGDTLAAETVKVDYDPSLVSLEFLTRMFFHAIDPTSLNRQGNDIGTQYRTGIYYTDNEDLAEIYKVFEEQRSTTEGEIVVEVKALQNFYAAEDYHQDYLDKNPDGYCHLPYTLFEFAKEANK
ncbi:MAG: peptide-methionine (S)-S-oxide reductase MsrA [Bacteroidales bacterium]|nr:peptide-methionine (S)-S-oxide reductase MsrA [Bacteroidales bacterium]MDY6075018.1 peptide-methionine (S)-S-oxide reductase MsrA [Bacteroidales bacterium]